MKDRNVDKAKTEITFQACFTGKDKKLKNWWFMNRGRGNNQNNGGRDSRNPNNSTFQKGENSYSRGGASSNYKADNNRERGERKKVDKRNVSCFNCQKFGHFLVNVMPTTNIHKKLKQSLQGKRVIMRAHC